MRPIPRSVLQESTSVHALTGLSVSATGTYLQYADRSVGQYYKNLSACAERSVGQYYRNLPAIR